MLPSYSAFCRTSITFLSLLLLPCLASGAEYYVMSSSSIQCPGQPCLNISDYAAQPSNYFSHNISLVFLPGEHVLSRIFTLRDADNLVLRGETSVSCLFNISFDIAYVTNVFISGLKFAGCDGNKVSRVHYFILEHAFIEGKSSKSASHPAFEISDVQEFIMFNTSLVSNEVDTTGIGCSALKLLSSNISMEYSRVANNFAASKSGIAAALCILDSTIKITDCIFSDNVGISGGAIYARQSMLEALGSSFTGNSAFSHGAVSYLSMATFFLDSCTISNNRAAKGGGALYLEVESTVEAENVTFQHNTALSTVDGGTGGVLRLASASTAAKFLTCIFIDNQANNSGVISSTGGTIYLTDSIFYYNKALSPDEKSGYGAILNTENGVSIFITGCVFKNNFASTSGGCMHVRNHTVIHINGSNTFKNNSAYYGGVFTVHYYSSIVIDTGDSLCSAFPLNFIGNSAEHGGVLNVIEHSIAHIQCSSFEGNKAKCTRTGCRGGAILARTNASVNLSNTWFHANQAIDKGGVMFAQFATIQSNGFLGVDSNEGGFGVFYLSSCNMYLAGNSTFSNNTNSLLARNSNVTFNGNVRFYGGTASNKEEGGAITVILSTMAFDGILQLENNRGMRGGAVSALESAIICNGDTTFHNNFAENHGGAVYAYKTKLQLVGRTTFYANNAAGNGSGILAFDSHIECSSDYISFIQNTASNGGAIYFDQTSSLTLIKKKMECADLEVWYCSNKNWMELVFAGNVAREKGGALYKVDSGASTCSSLTTQQSLSSLECFIQSIAAYESANDWNLTTANFANINFTNNSAPAGPLLYGALLDRCRVNSFAEQLQISKGEVGPSAYFSNMIFTDFSFNDITSAPVRICLCENNVANCSLLPQETGLKTGQTLNMSVAIVDQVNKTLDGRVRAYLSSKSSRIIEGQSDQPVSKNCSLLVFNIYSAEPDVTLSLYPDGPCNDHGISKLDLDVIIDNKCPIGFALSDSGLECECGPEVKNYITNCSIGIESVFREGSFWISSFFDGNSSGVIVHNHCPYDYCLPSTEKVGINLNHKNGSDAQCAFHRSSLLCGSCKDGYSLTLGSSECAKCSNYWVFLILPFGLAGLGLVVIMMTCNLTVASGTINGLLFYANILIANRTIFYPPLEQNFLTVFVSWLGLNLGIATCFYDGMDSFWKTWVQISFEGYIIALMIAIVLLGKSTKVSSFFHKYKLNPIHTLATLIMLSYEKLSRRIFSLLASTHVKYPNGTSAAVWLFDPNVGYLEGKHISLAIMAIFIIVTGIIFNLVLILSKCLIARSKVVWVNSFLQAFIAPFKPRHQYWAGLLLLIRNTSYFMSECLNAAGNPDNSLNFVFVLLIGILALKFTYMCIAKLSLRNLVKKKHGTSPEYPPLRSEVKDSARNRHASDSSMSGIVYKSPALDLLETSFLVNLVLLTYFTLDKTKKQAILFYFSSSIVLVTFLGIVIYHVCVYIAALFKISKSNRDTELLGSDWSSGYTTAPAEPQPPTKSVITFP